MAKVAGHDGDVSGFEQQLQRIRASFDKVFWTGTEYRSPDFIGDTDDRGNALAVLAGLAPQDHYSSLRKVLMHHFNASPYMEKYVLEALFVMNDPDDALARMKKRYQRMVDDKYTTLDENWTGGSHNHGWSGGPLTLLSQKAAGLAPDSPGWERYTINPQPGSLKSIDASVDTPRGVIHLILTRDGKKLSVSVDSPPDTVGHINLPVNADDIKVVRLDGTDMPGEHVGFLLGPGKTSFEIVLK